MIKQMKLVRRFFNRFFLEIKTGLETSMNDSDFVFYCVHLLHYKCHKTNCKRGEAYKNSSYRTKSKKAVINSINENDNKCCQYDVTVALNHVKIGKHLKNGKNETFYK